jgi:acetolactate synthase-1/2/3 large subunit
MGPSLTGAGVMVEVLERHGVSHVFGLCGHTNVAVLAALERSPIRFVGVHHEQMASHAADGYARLARQPGVVLTHLGPGLTNALTGVANASFDQVPLVVVTGNVQSYFFGRHAHMETTMHADADQARAFAPFCKRIWNVDRADALVPALDAAFRLATTAPAGPVLIDVAMDVFSTHAELPGDWEPTRPAAPAGLDPALAARIAELLLQAARPVLYAGGGVVSSDGGSALRQLAEALGAPVAYALMGKGALPDEHPLCVGMSGLWGTPAANAACREADVILAVGAEFGELDSSSWRAGTTFAIPPSRLLHVHEDPAEIGRSYRPEVGVTADARLALEAILDKVPPVSGVGGLREELARLRRDFALALEKEQTSSDMPMAPARVLADIRAGLPGDAVVVGDTGWNKNGIGQQWPVSSPLQFLAPGGYATMGFGPSAALGAALCEPRRPVMALVGDGAFLSNLSVVVTAVEEQIPVVWAVMNNSAYATISGMQRRHFGSDYGAVFDSTGLDYAAFARSVGADGTRIDAADQLADAVRTALSTRQPHVIDIRCSTEPVPTTGHWDINSLFEAGTQSE